jgi:hypothetical protein
VQLQNVVLLHHWQTHVVSRYVLQSDDGIVKVEGSLVKVVLSAAVLVILIMP